MDDIRAILSKHNKSEITAYETAMKTLNDNKPDLKILDTQSPPLNATENMRDVFEKFDKITESLNEISRIIEIEKYLDLALIHKSRTWASNVQGFRVRFRQSMDELKESTQSHDDDIVKSLYEIIKGSIDDKIVNALLEATSTNFLLYISKYILDELNPRDKARFIARIEERKDRVLGVVDVAVDSFQLPQRLLSTHNIYPITQSLPLPKLVELLKEKVGGDGDGGYGGGYGDDGGDSVNGGATTNATSIIDTIRAVIDDSTAVVFIDKSGFNAVEYDAATLLSLPYVMANNLQTSTTAGINDTSIKRFSTIRQLKSVDKFPKNPISHDVDGGGGRGGASVRKGTVHTHAIIISTIDSNTYHILGEKFNEYKVHIDVARAIIGAPPSRPLAYNKIHNDVISAKFDPTTQRVDTYQHHPKMFKSYEGIILHIITRLNDKFREFIESSGVDSAEGFLRAVEAQRELILRTANYIIGREMDLDKLSDEYKMSFVMAFHDLASEVNKKLQSYIDHFTMSETLFKQTTGRDLYNQLASVYKAQITKMFNELDEYPSYFATFEMPLKVYVVNKKVFLH
jgi:hypothetical protein